MALTYQEFKKTVPKETSDFFDTLLPYLNYYSGNEIDVVFKDTAYNSTGEDSKVFFLSMYALSELKEYKAFLGELGFQKHKYKLANVGVINNDLEKNYEKFNYLLPVYNDKTLYQGLQPLEIVISAFNKYYNRSNTSLFDELFTAVTISGIKTKINNAINSKKQIHDREIEKEIYTDVPISVISYIETASKIRSLLINKLSYQKNEIAKELDIDTVPLSLLLSIFFNNNNASKDNLNNQKALECLFQEKGVYLENILKSLNININQSEVRSTPKNMFAIKSLYEKYYKVGNTLNINPTSVSIQGIIKSILNRNITNSIAIEKLLSSMNCSLDMFKNIESDTIKAVEMQKRNLEQESVKAFYKDLPKKTRDFIEFAVKTYSVLIEKIQDENYDDKILSTEEDAVVLALYISSTYYNSKLNVFFNDHDVTYQKVLNLLKLDLKKEEIDRQELNQKILVEKFKRFVYEGENRNISSNNLTIDSISLNTCKKDFNQSMILQNIFNTLSTAEIGNDFLSQLNNYIEEKERKQNIEKTQKLFHDMPVETIEIIENASRIYNKLLKSEKNIDKKSAQSISILISSLKSNNKEAIAFLNEQGFQLQPVCNYFNIDIRYLKSNSIDIDLLTNEYGLLIFGLANKDRKREDLSPINILRNIFSKEFNNSVAMSKFLSEFDANYEKLENFDDLYKKYKEKQIRRNKDDEINSSLNGYPKGTIAQIKDATKVQRLIEDRVKDKIKDEEELETLSMVIALFIDDTSIRRFFEKNNVTRESIIARYNLPDDLFISIEKQKVDFDLLEEKYKKYIKIDPRKDKVSLSNVFKSLTETNPYLEQITGLSKENYKKLYRELITGKDYEETLTISDRREELDKCEVEKIDSTNIQSIMDFGNSLLPHSKYIHSEVPSLIKSDINNDSVTDLTTIIDNIYFTEEQDKKEKGLFSKIFKPEEETVSINKYKLCDLKNGINRHLERLKKDILRYDELRRYVETYIVKNKEYYDKTDEVLTNINLSIANLNPDDDEDYADYLTQTSILHIVSDKQNRFATVNMLMKKELLRINQAIVNHFVTINSLEMARDDLIPLIESEMMIASGEKNKKEALDLSRNIFGLFTSLLNRNVDSTIENMNILQQSTVPQELLTSISNDINTHIQGISQIKLIESKINPTEEKAKQKVIDKK